MTDRGGATTGIDLHVHFFPPSARRALGTGELWFGAMVETDPRGAPSLIRNGKPRTLGRADHLLTIDERLARMDAMRVGVQVLSLAPPLSGYDLDPATTTAMAAQTNDELADTIAAHPDRFLGFASLPAQDAEASVRELERMMARPGIVGVAVMTHVNGRDWDDSELESILAAAERLGALVFMHPQNPRSPALGRYRLGNLIGNPFDTTIAAASLIFGGVLDRLPDLRLIIAHGGGYLPFATGRFGHGYDVRPEASEIARQAPRDYLRRFHVDTVVYDDRLVRLLLDQMGPDRVVLGTDFPGDMSPDDPVRDIERNPWLSEAEATAVIRGTAADLLRSRAEGLLD